MATRQALFFSRYESAKLGRLSIRPEHVLLGVIRGDGRSSRDLWKTNGVTLDEARAAVVDPNEPRDEVIEPVQIPFQDATKALFTAAAEEADRLGHAKISTAHVVLALLRNEGAASSFLRARGITLEAARAAAALAESPLAGEDL
jgi:ATP-dependent Clp protease ATP-binding subunit ClpA